VFLRLSQAAFTTQWRICTSDPKSGALNQQNWKITSKEEMH